MYIFVLVDLYMVLILMHWRSPEEVIGGALLLGSSALRQVILFEVVGRIQTFTVATHFLKVVDNQPSVLLLGKHVF